VAPAGVPIPRKGVASFAYKICVFARRPDLVPRLGKREQYTYEVNNLEERLRFLASHLQITISFVNIKGGASKTTIAVYCGAIIANVTRLTVRVLPATQATATSTLALNSGIDPRDQLTVSGFAQVLKELPTYREQSARIPLTVNGLGVLSEDAAENVSKQYEFATTDFVDVVDAVHPNTDALLFDTGNDDVKDGSIVLEAVRRSDVVVFTATADKPVTLAKLGSSITTYLTDLTTDENISLSPGRHRSEKEISTQEKTKTSLAVVSGVGRKADPESYQKYTQRLNDAGEVVGNLGVEGKFHTIPWDSYMSTNIVANLDKIDKQTYLEFLKLCVLMYEKAAVLRGYNAETLGRTDAKATAEAHSPEPSNTGAFLRSASEVQVPTPESR